MTVNKPLLYTILSLLTTFFALLTLLTGELYTPTLIEPIKKEIVDMSAPIDVTINLEDFRREDPAYELK